MNKKGFTLIEVIVVVIIIGTISAISIPVIRKISDDNKNSIYEQYRNVLVEYAKIYVEDYKDDLFNGTRPERITACDLYKKYLIKDITVNGSDCICKESDCSKCSVDSSIVVSKDSNGYYKYKAKLNCTNSKYNES